MLKWEKSMDLFGTSSGHSEDMVDKTAGYTVEEIWEELGEENRQHNLRRPTQEGECSPSRFKGLLPLSWEGFQLF